MSEETQDAPGGEVIALPAQDMSAEQAVLGSLMLSSTAVGTVADRLRPEHFYRPEHQVLYARMLEMYLAGTPIDAITLSAELQAYGEMPHRLGGAVYLHDLIASVPTAANISFYADQVLETAVRRRLGEVGSLLEAYATSAASEVREIVQRSQDRIREVADAHEATTGTAGGMLTDLLQPTLEDVEAIASGTNQGLPTGYADLDAVTHGFHPGQLIVLAARPGVGKSAMAMDFCRTATIRHGRGAVLFSLEMGRSELVMRLLSAESQVRLDAMRGGRMTSSDWDRLTRRIGDVDEAPLVIDDDGSVTPLELTARARRWAQKLDGLPGQPGLGLIVVDYMQLMSPTRQRDSRQSEVSEISRALKLLAKELDVPVVALSQLNREPEKRQDKKPSLADLRESGSIEQDADVVMLIHRPDAAERDDPRMGEADLILAKHRAGPTTTITLAHQLHYSRFVDMAQE